MSLKPTYNIVQHDLYQTANLFYEGKPLEAQKSFTRVCNNSKQAEHGVYQKLWEVMGKPQGHPDYGRAAMWGNDGIYVASMKKAEAVFKYILTTQEGKKLSISEKGLKVVRKLDCLIHPRPKNPTAKLAVESAQLALSLFGCFMLSRGLYRSLSYSLHSYSQSLKGTNLAHGLEMEMVEHELQKYEIYHEQDLRRDAYERMQGGGEMTDRDYQRAYDYVSYDKS